MDRMRVDVETGRSAGNIVPLAEELMNMAIAFFADPENEREYQEWKKARKARKGA